MDQHLRKAKRSGPRPRPLAEQAYEQIREKIIRLHFLPGQYLNEAAICEVLGLGRTPVHQALQLLQQEGLVEIMPRKGIIVLPDSVKEILNILESRLTVEPELARKAAERFAAGEIAAGEGDALMKLAEAPDENADPPDVDRFIENDRAFHRRINELSGNDTLGEFATTLHDRSCRFWYLNLWRTLNVGVSKAKHVAIARAIRAGRGDDAAGAMRDHIENLAERLRQLPPGSLAGRG